MKARLSPAYDPYVLSEEEKSRFKAALGDGFGSVQLGPLIEEEFPPNLETGLLDHKVYRANVLNSDFEYDSVSQVERQLETCPINFTLGRVQPYFREQRKIFLEHVRSLKKYKEPKDLSLMEREPWDDFVYFHFSRKHYTKSWYEQFINWRFKKIDQILRMQEYDYDLPWMLFLVWHSGVVGRLIEQYYWKFFHERNAITGSKISRGGVRGAALTAGKLKPKHEKWRREAEAIWANKPRLSKIAVARSLITRLKLHDYTERHVARVLVKPAKAEK
jgi:hypothetical protein